ncbi:MAG: SulP family inorganic anion transporter [Bacteroidetes bacterium]|nr:SulP family inorganic anion transporter [Bacteroidota bacterium]
MSSTPSFKDYIKSLPNDLTASVVVFLVALPLCLGVALASNAPLFSGIIAGVIGGIVVGLASRSHLSVSGPAAGLTAIVAGSLALLPSFEAFLLAVVIAGMMQLILGFAKAGVIGDFVPGSVIKGMLAAIGLILLINQFPHLLGDDSQFETDEGVPRKGNIFSNFFFAFTNINTSAFIIGGLALLLNIFWEKFQKGKTGIIRFVPGPLLMVILGVAMNQIFESQNWLPALTGEHLVILPMANTPTEFFSFFTSPDWSQLGNSAVLTVAVTLALVASLETLLSIEAVDELDPYQRVTPTNRELKAQGLGNIVSGLLGGLPVTSVIVRSSANVNSGAKTKMSTIYHGTLLLLCVAFIPFLLNQIPKSALAAVLIFTGYKLAKPSLFIGFYKKGWNQFLPFVGTILAILATDLLKGVLIGIGIAIIFIIRTNFKSAIVVVNDTNKYLVRLRKDVSFLNKAILKQGLEKVPANSYVIIDVSRADFIDQDILEIIEDFQKHAPLENIKVEIKQNPYKKSIFNNA